MIYECYRCKKLTKDDDGVIIHHKAFSPFIFMDIIGIVFICKDCLSPKGKEKLKEFNKLSEETIKETC